MKSVFLILIFVLSMNSFVISQSKKFIGGAMIGFYGVHINGEIGEFYSQTNGKLWGTGGISAGLSVDRYFSKKIYGSMELRYTKKGSVYEFLTSYGTKAFESIRLDYIELPLLIGFRLNLNRKHLFFESGFSYARLFYSKMQVSELNWWNTSERLEQFKDNEFSWVANLKYPMIKNEKLLLGFRFTYSLSSIHYNYDLYNMTYGVELNYLFNKNLR